MKITSHAMALEALSIPSNIVAAPADAQSSSQGISPWPFIIGGIILILYIHHTVDSGIEKNMRTFRQDNP